MQEDTKEEAEPLVPLLSNEDKQTAQTASASDKPEKAKNQTKHPEKKGKLVYHRTRTEGPAPQKKEQPHATTAAKPNQHFSFLSQLQQDILPAIAPITIATVAIAFAVSISAALIAVLTLSNFYFIFLLRKRPASPSKPIGEQSSADNTANSEALTKTAQKRRKRHQEMLEQRKPQFTVVCSDAIAWMKAQEKLPGFVITSLPDITELVMEVNEYKKWFVDAAALVLEKLPPDSSAIFYQTDTKVFTKEGTHIMEWVDKSHLCNLAAERVGCKMLWHKIMLLTYVGAIKPGKKPPYTHMICFTNSRTDNAQKIHLPDVDSRGDMLWPKGMGLKAASIAVKYCMLSGAQTIVDPFCGKGSVLFVANYYGLDAIGVDINPGRLRGAESIQARQLDQIRDLLDE